jgi:hypothetical protein
MSREFGLGRLVAPMDARNNQFRMLAAIPQVNAAVGKPKPRKKRYKEGELLYQGAKPHCVSYSGKGFMIAAPIMRAENYDTTEVYRACQDNDEWPGNNYDGTSVHALMRVLKDRGMISSHVWGQTVDEMNAWIMGGYGTAIVGTDWFPSMDEVDSKGFVNLPGVNATPIGGHAYRIVWYDKSEDAEIIRNSWGDKWGLLRKNGTRDGEAKIRRADFDRLRRAQGEIAAATQIKIKATII